MNLNHNRILKKLYNKYDYIINVDYGSLNGRKHYHGIILTNEEPISWQYGFCNFKKIDNCNTKALSTYIIKLTRHSLKVNEKIIYSRGKRLGKLKEVREKLKDLCVYK